jgi:hypothetical protein
MSTMMGKNGCDTMHTSRVNKFGAFCRNSMDSVRPEFKNHRITVHKFKKNQKIRKKYVKN